jgi:hypothetical protein
MQWPGTCECKKLLPSRLHSLFLLWPHRYYHVTSNVHLPRESLQILCVLQINLFGLWFFFLLEVLGFEHRALGLVGWYSSTWVTAPALLALVIFEIISFYDWDGLDYDPPICVFHVVGITDACHVPNFLLVEVGKSHKLFLGLALNQEPPNLHPLSN